MQFGYTHCKNYILGKRFRVAMYHRCLINEIHPFIENSLLLDLASTIDINRILMFILGVLMNFP